MNGMLDVVARLVLLSIGIVSCRIVSYRVGHANSFHLDQMLQSKIY